MTNDVQELHLRICRLEAEVTRAAGHVETLRRRWRRTLCGGIVVAALTLASVTSFTLSAQEPTTYKDMTVTGTFRVVDKSGKIIMIVGESVPLRGVSLRDEQGNSRISLIPISTPGISLEGNGDVGVSLASGIHTGVYIRRLASKDPASQTAIPAHVEAALEANESEGGKLSVATKAGTNILYVADAVSPGDGRVAIGTTAGGAAFGIRVYSSAGNKLLTSMGETKSGEGAVAAYDGAGLARAVMFGKDGQFSAMSTAGMPIASLSSRDNQGIVGVSTASGVAVVSLTSEGGAGRLELANAAGNAMVEAGLLSSGVGVVRAYPLGTPGAGLVGMPGTFIMGRTGGK